MSTPYIFPLSQRPTFSLFPNDLHFPSFPTPHIFPLSQRPTFSLFPNAPHFPSSQTTYIFPLSQRPTFPSFPTPHIFALPLRLCDPEFTQNETTAWKVSTPYIFSLSNAPHFPSFPTPHIFPLSEHSTFSLFPYVCVTQNLPSMRRPPGKCQRPTFSPHSQRPTCSLFPNSPHFPSFPTLHIFPLSLRLCNPEFTQRKTTAWKVSKPNILFVFPYVCVTQKCLGNEAGFLSSPLFFPSLIFFPSFLLSFSFLS